jgi:hypothetical protein
MNWLPSLKTLRLWVQIQLGACMFAFIIFLLSCAWNGLVTGWSLSKESYRLSIRLRNWSKNGSVSQMPCASEGTSGNNEWISVFYAIKFIIWSSPARQKHDNVMHLTCVFNKLINFSFSCMCFFKLLYFTCPEILKE